MLSRRACRWAVIVTTTFIAAGCTPEAHQYIRFPDFFNPGPAGFQRAEAIRHDPYPLNDVGPPIEGGRPREYQQPVNEVDRAFMAAPPRPVLQPAPAIFLPPTPPPVVTTPYPPAPAVPPQTTPFQAQPRAPY